MARPTTKASLIILANEKFESLLNLIDSLSENQKSASFSFPESASRKEAHWNRDQNIRDVLAHLFEWHQLIINWVTSNKKGENKAFLPEPYNWRTYGEMNLGFFNKHQNTSYNEAVDMLKESHDTVMKKITEFNEDELFLKGKLLWTGTSTLGSYFVSSTSSHYDWAIKKIELHKKILNE